MAVRPLGVVEGAELEVVELGVVELGVAATRPAVAGHPVGIPLEAIRPAAAIQQSSNSKVVTTRKVR